MMSRLVGLNFHGIGVPARRLDPGEDAYWITPDRFEAILDRIMALPDPARIRITFDDGNLSDHDIALPLLAARGLQAKFFVLTSRIGKAGSLDPAQIRNLQAAGMEIGSHGMDHLDWTRLAPDALRHELTDSRQILEDICGRPIPAVSVPFGIWNRQVMQAISAAGYECAYTSDGGTMRPDAFIRPRNSVRNNMSAARLEAIMHGRVAIRSRIRTLLRHGRISRLV